MEHREGGGAAGYLGGGASGIFKTKMGDNLLKIFVDVVYFFVNFCFSSLWQIFVAKVLNMQKKFKLFYSKIQAERKLSR